MDSLHGKLALITGAASGIGRALAIELARQGVDLFLIDIDSDGLLATAQLAAQYGGRIEWQVADLCCSDAMAHLTRRVQGEFPSLDILVNNAGVAYYGTTHEMSDQQWRRLLGVNLLAPLQLTHQLLPTLLARPEAHILNICSIAGLVGVARLSAYNATKFALVGFSESLRAEYGSRGLGVTALCPGLVQTGIFQSAMTGGAKSVPRFPRWITASPQRVARRAVRAIRKNQGLVVVSASAQLIWWVKRLSPSFFERIQRIRRVSRSGPIQSDPQPAAPRPSESSRRVA